MRSIHSTSLLSIVFLFTALISTSSCTQKEEEEGLLESKFFTDSIESNYLKSVRKHHIYLPQGFTETKSFPILYSTDGNDEESFSFIKTTLDSLISNQIIEPIIFVGSFANSEEVPNSKIHTEDGQILSLHYRFFEYVESNPQYETMPGTEQIFGNHMRYFTEELIATIESTYKQELSAKDRYFYGYSNGAGFGINLMNTHPELIGTYICFSTLGSGTSWKSWNSSSTYPNLYLEYGTQEGEGYSNEANAIKAIYQETGSPLKLKTYEGGHDVIHWNEELKSILIALFKTN